jgi:hypothetical protein
LHHLAEFVQQPRQRHFQAHGIVSHLYVRGRDLSDRPDPEIQPVA